MDFDAEGEGSPGTNPLQTSGDNCNYYDQVYRKKHFETCEEENVTITKGKGYQ